MALIEKIDNDLKTAMREKKTVSVSALRLLKSAIKNAEIAKGVEKLADQDILGVLSKQIQQRKESIEQYAKGGRQDLVDMEKSEMEVLTAYVPAQIGDHELESLIRKLLTDNQIQSKKDFGKAMRLAQETLKGQADNKRMSNVLNNLLS